MKKMISLLAAAMLATVFAAGCAKTKCADATTQGHCESNDDKFFGENKANLQDKDGCKWFSKVGVTDDAKKKTNGICVAKKTEAGAKATCEHTMTPESGNACAESISNDDDLKGFGTCENSEKDKPCKFTATKK